MTSRAVVTAKGLCKTFRSRGREIEAVRNVSFQVAEGELFGLFGPNGAGKTTLLRMLSTLLAPTRGSAKINGFDVQTESVAVRASLGLVASDERAFYGRLSTAQNLVFYAALQGIHRSNIRARVDYVLDLFGLQDKKDSDFQSLSTGQKQRLNMARSLLHDPPILFLDEPTKSMDVQTSDFARNLIKHDLVGRQRKTVLFISHDLYEMDSFCDRVAVLAEGEIRGMGTPHELGQRLPRRAIYRIQVEGDADDITARWRLLPSVESVSTVSQGLATAAFDIALREENSGVWLQVMQAVADCGGRVETYRRLDDSSLRQIIKYFSHQGSS